MGGLSPSDVSAELQGGELLSSSTSRGRADGRGQRIRFSALHAGPAFCREFRRTFIFSFFILLFVLLLLLVFQVLVEMEEATDAQKLLDHFSSNSLKINREAITVTFSREFRSLM